jgi:hypothetical protein
MMLIMKSEKVPWLSYHKVVQMEKIQLMLVAPHDKQITDTGDMCPKYLAAWIQTSLTVQQDRQKYYYEKKSRMRSYSVGNTVLILLPSDSSKLKALWKGPFTIIRKLNDVDYEIRIGGNKGVKSYHVNMLRKW